MIHKVTSRLRWAVATCALAGVMVGAGGGLFSSFAQGDGYYCPAQYQTCSDSGWGEYYDTPSEGGLGGGTTSSCDGAGGKWVCEGSTSSTGDTKASCKISGCHRYSNDYPVQVCTFIPSDANTKCPPMDPCVCQ